MRVSRWAASLAPVLAITLVASGAAPIAAGASAAHWRKSFTSSYQPSSAVGTVPVARFDAVVAFGAHTAFAAGERLTDSFTAGTPLVYRWNGVAWSPMAVQPPAPVGDEGGDIQSLAGTSAADLWLASGAEEAGGGTSARIQHWDGLSWATVTRAGLPPYWSGSLADRHGSVWLVGTQSSDQLAVALGNGSAFIARYDAARSRWVTSRAARLGQLSAITVTGKRGWAVGSARVGRFDFSGMPLIDRWNGRTWKRVATPRRTMSLVDVAARSARSALAIDEQQALRWNGTRWRLVAPPAGRHRFDAVTVDPAGGYWVAGSSKAHARRSVYYRYFKGKWSRTLGPKRTLQHGPDQYVEITDLASAGGLSWGVGFDAANDCGDLDGCPDTTAGALVIDRNN